MLAVNPWMQLLATIVGAIAGAIGAYVALRKDRREASKATKDEADRTITLLEKQNEILERQTEEANAREKRRDDDFAKERAAWARREEKFDNRIEELERWRIKEIEARRQLQMCAKAPDCPDYDAGNMTPECTD